MSKRVTPFLTLILVVGLFHQCSHDLSEEIAPVSSTPLFYQIRASEDANFIEAARQVFGADDDIAARNSLPNFYPSNDSIVVGRDFERNLVHFSLAIYDTLKPESNTLHNLVVSINANREAYANIYSYIPDNDKAFSRMKFFTGDFVIFDLEGNELTRHHLVDGNAHQDESLTNGRTQKNCLVTTHYVTSTVKGSGKSDTRIDYVEISDCRESGTSGGSGVGSVNLNDEERRLLGGGNGGVPVNSLNNSSGGKGAKGVEPGCFKWSRAPGKEERETAVKFPFSFYRSQLRALLNNFGSGPDFSGDVTLWIALPLYDSNGKYISDAQAQNKAATAAEEAYQKLAKMQLEGLSAAEVIGQAKQIFWLSYMLALKDGRARVTQNVPPHMRSKIRVACITNSN